MNRMIMNTNVLQLIAIMSIVSMVFLAGCAKAPATGKTPTPTPAAPTPAAPSPTPAPAPTAPTTPAAPGVTS